MDDVWKEVLRLDKKAQDKGFESAESIYEHLPRFCDDSLMVEGKYQDLIRIYNYSKLTSTPPFKTMEETPAQFVDDILAIDRQYHLIQESNAKKHKES